MLLGLERRGNPVFDSALPLVGRGHPGTVAMNVIWTLYNVMMLGVVNAVAYETKQNRGQVRVSLKLPATLHLQDGSTTRSTNYRSLQQRRSPSHVWRGEVQRRGADFR